MVRREAAFAVKTRLLKREAGRLHAELLHTQRLSLEQLQQLQDERSLAIARFAMTNTDFYRDRYARAGITEADLGDPAAFSELPVIHRADVKEHAAAISSTEARPEHERVGTTGGSTGEPVRVAIDTRVPLLALAWRMISWWGVSPSDDVAHIGQWGPATWRTRLRAWPSRDILLEATSLSHDDIVGFVADVNRIRPPLIEGYVGALREIAEYVAAEGVEFAAPRAIGSTAAPLGDTVRARIESVLGAPVHDQYRCAEVPWMAGECALRDGLHVFADLRRLEIVDDDGRPLPPGNEGHVVVTDLVNRVFPLIRYRLGDLSSMRGEPCPCGVTLPIVESVAGRESDTVRLPDGTVIPAGWNLVFAHDPQAARLFQIHQHADYSLSLRVVPGDSPTIDESIEEARRRLLESTGDQVPVRVERVPTLPYTRGKIRYVISDID